MTSLQLYLVVRKVKLGEFYAVVAAVNETLAKRKVRTESNLKHEISIRVERIGAAALSITKSQILLWKSSY